MGLVAAAAATPLALGYRFAVVYRRRAGFPARRPILETPPGVGLACEEVAIDSPGGRLPGWFLPARGGARGPGVVLVHGWESNRARMLPNARFLVAAGFHCLCFDVRGHGENGPERLPISVGEFGADAAAALRALRARPEVDRVAILGHSMGAAGAVLAAAAEPWLDALVSVAAPADPRLLTRQTFRLAHLPIPSPIAVPLAWLVARVYVRPRGHSVAALSARRAIRHYPGPVLLIHGDADEVIPFGDLHRLEVAAARRPAGPTGERPRLEALVVPAGLHRWLYEDATYRRVVARFLAETLGGPLEPELAGRVAAELDVRRPADTEGPISSLVAAAAPGGAEA